MRDALPRSPRLLLLLLLAGLLWLGGRAAAPAAVHGQTAPAEQAQASDHAKSPPLRGTPPLKEDHSPRDKPLRLLPHSTGNQPDPVVQSSPGPAVAASSGLGFAGVGQGDYGVSDNAAPPDTNLAVGDSQVVQWVNESFAVFDKTSGALLYGPAAGNTLWQALPSTNGCHHNNDGDPIAQFDRSAHRWVLTQFSVSSPSTYHYLQCVAVSQTADATGAYNLYSFDYGSSQFVDYPKLGVWPDAYYVSYNIFTNGSSFAGAKVCALDRTNMLAGNPAGQQCVQLSNAYGSLLPADLDGATPPPAGEPNLLLSFSSNALLLWRFHVDWSSSANTSLSGPLSIPVAAFSAACNGGGSCIPQPGTSQQLDSLADRLMWRLAYRHFADHEALVVTHAVTAAGGQVGLRWYELRNPGGGSLAAGTPVVYQQSTYAPDATYRWLGSIAMDQAGDIALGYSASSSSVKPAVAYAARAAADPPGTLGSETVLKAGGGSQSYPGGLSRWGDYSAMRVDPSDDCTFWYTNEYLKADGGFNWSSWISSFKVAGCGSSGGGAPVVTAVAPASGPAAGGTSVGISGSNLAGATAVTFGSVAAASFSCGTATSCTAVSPAGSGTVHVSVTTPSGTSATTTADQFTYNPATASDFTVSASPSSQSVRAGKGANYTVSLTTTSGYNAAVTLSATGGPAGSSYSFSANPVTPTSSGATSTLRVTVPRNSAQTSYTLTITAAGSDPNHTTHTTTVTLVVQ